MLLGPVRPKDAAGRCQAGRQICLSGTSRRIEPASVHRIRRGPSTADWLADRRPAFRIERAALYWGSSSNNRKEVIQCLIVNRRVRQTGSSPRWERISPNGTRLQRFSRTLARQWRGRPTGRPLFVWAEQKGWRHTLRKPAEPEGTQFSVAGDSPGRELRSAASPSPQ